jgi:hypothetical protein
MNEGDKMTDPITELKREMFSPKKDTSKIKQYLLRTIEELNGTAVALKSVVSLSKSINDLKMDFQTAGRVQGFIVRLNMLSETKIQGVNVENLAKKLRALESNLKKDIFQQNSEILNYVKRILETYDKEIKTPLLNELRRYN